MKNFLRSFLVITLCFFLAMPLPAQEIFDFGDAPEASVAYPSTGVIGAFPTCLTVGTTFVLHNNFGAHLGPAFDFEPDGNGGLCPAFAPYDNDECFADGDAGLLVPESYTIVNNTVVPCPGFVGTPLGNPCTMAAWGINVDIDVTNFMPNQSIGYMNVIIDFNQNGAWGDQVSCPPSLYPEHVLQNFIVPWGFTGPLSALMPPAFMIGPNSGYVWARFSITEQPVFLNWDGHGSFEDGESEDYLLHIAPLEQSDFGDAPEDVLAYPSTGTNGAFPTCIGTGVNGHVEHFSNGADLGSSVDFEVEGNGGLCPTFAPYDNDECFQDNDAGLIMPEPFTIVAGIVVPCTNSNGTGLGQPCDTAVWGVNVDINVNNFSFTQADVLMNVLIDWNKDGDWGDTVYCTDLMVPEHVLQNFIVPHGYSGALSGLAPPDFIIGPEPGYFWCRFTISDVAVNVPWDGNGVFDDGESEDYLIRVDTAATGEEYEYGDAPEGAVAYPLLGVMGNFPTCMNVATNGYIQHNNFGAFLGPTFDFEPDGNGGLCPTFAPYDNDECFNDGDAGLLFPDPYTIQGGAVVPCPNGAGTSLGTTCSQAVWGTDIDIQVQNFMPNQTIGYMNVVFDWTQNGVWGDVANCPGATAPEHVLHNFPVPNGYSGPLSGLGPPNFTIGPNGSYVWARFMISEAMMPLNWDGQGAFEDGESEDYLIHVVMPPPPEGDYGDAPDSALAYPASGQMGNFPTCIYTGPPNTYVFHGIEEVLFFGPFKDFEADGNAGLCSPYTMPYNNDECYQDNDAGLIVPGPYTIQFSGGVYTVVPCLGNGGILDTICNMVHWGPELDIHVTNLTNNEAVVNVLMDFNMDGKWALDPTTLCVGNVVPEHVLVNFPVPAGYSGPLSALGPPPFMAGPYVGYLWTRFSVSEQPVVTDWDGAGSFEMGESEDYILYVDVIPGIGEGETPGSGINLQVFPNPARDACSITYELTASCIVRIELFDIRGSVVNVLADELQSPGMHKLNWDGRNSDGQHVGAGIYMIKASLNSLPVQRTKVLLTR